ncbi:MAG: LysR family transcriptional regulator [Clostridia bacterium]|nr:LysR family transcriptional regulator [Clostridia bacterium]
MEPHFRVWLEQDGEPVFGEGVYRLLLGVDRLGSINQAAKSLAMSYRQAWGHIQKTERRLGVRLLERQVGGEAGGGARLTAAGREWLEHYRRFQAEVEEAVEAAFRRNFLK